MHEECNSMRDSVGEGEGVDKHDRPLPALCTYERSESWT